MEESEGKAYSNWRVFTEVLHTIAHYTHVAVAGKHAYLCICHTESGNP